MSNADVYIQKFKELELVVRENFGLKEWESITNFLSRQGGYSALRDELKYCQEVRNLLQHKPKISGEFPVEPTFEMIAFLEETIDSLKNRKKCREIMVPRSEIFCRSLSDPVRSTVSEMRKHSHNHVPVLGKGETVAGIFTAVSLLRLVADSENHSLRPETRFSDIKDYIALDHHSSEIYRFVNGEVYVDELEELFVSSYENGKRLSMVFVTSNGGPSGRLLGIISPWDVLGTKEQG